VNHSGYDLGIVTARFSTDDSAYLEVSSDGGSTFSSSLTFGPLAAVGTGAYYEYYYGNVLDGCSTGYLYVTPVDLLDFGILDDATIMQ